MENDTLNITISGSITKVGYANNIVSALSITRGGDDVSSNYSFGTPNVGVLTVKPRPITLTSGTSEVEYSAQVLKNENISVGGEGWVVGESAVYSGFAEILDVGSVSNTFTYDAGENTNLDNYTITPVYGTLTVNKVSTELIVTANSNEKTYDGTALTDSGIKFSPALKGNNETVEAEIVGSQTDAGTSENSVDKVKILRGNVDITKNYTLGTYINGTLTVKPRPITLISSPGE